MENKKKVKIFRGWYGSSEQDVIWIQPMDSPRATYIEVDSGEAAVELLEELKHYSENGYELEFLEEKKR